MKISVCKICSNSFTVKAGCKGIYCSRDCAESGKIIRARLIANDQLLVKQTEYQKFPNRCEHCNTQLSFEKRHNKFCNVSCSAKYNNARRNQNGWRHSEDTKEKLRAHAINNPSGIVALKIGNGKPACHITKTCPTCNNNFVSRKSQNKVFCSKTCIKKGGIRSGSGRAKTGWYNGIYCGSTYELAFLIWNLDHNIKISRCTKSFEYEYDGKTRRYYPDFEIEDQIFEIKGKLSDIDLVKIKAANAVLINAEKIKMYIDYVCKKYNVPKTKIYTLYE